MGEIIKEYYYTQLFGNGKWGYDGAKAHLSKEQAEAHIEQAKLLFPNMPRRILKVTEEVYSE